VAVNLESAETTLAALGYRLAEAESLNLALAAASVDETVCLAPVFLTLEKAAVTLSYLKKWIETFEGRFLKFAGALETVAETADSP
jgi:hypothetical protein